jgi:hypothetical protein
VIRYGPVDGSGSSEVSVAGALPGTGAANSDASTFSKSASGATRWMMIVPVLSSTTMPLIPPFWCFANFFAPTMFRKKAAPAESRTKLRSTVFLKSLALTRAPFE